MAQILNTAVRKASVGSLSLLLHLLAVLLVVLLLLQTTWAQDKLQGWLRSQGVPLESFEVEQLTPSRLVLGSIAFEEAMEMPEIRALRLDVRSHWLDLAWRLLRGEVADWTLFVELDPAEGLIAGPALEADMQVLRRSRGDLATSGQPLDSTPGSHLALGFSMEADWRIQPLTLDQALRFAEGLSALESQFAELEVTDPKGLIQAEGTLHWQYRPDTNVHSPKIAGNLRLSNIGLVLPWLEMNGLNADIRIEDLLMPDIPDGQRILVAELNPGIPLKDTLLRFGLKGDKLGIQRLDAQFAGGHLRLDPLNTRLTDHRRRLAAPRS